MAKEMDPSAVSELEFDQRIRHLEQIATELPVGLGDVEDFLHGISLERALESLKAARDASRGGCITAAWVNLAVAAEILGQLRGWADARQYFTAEQGVKELLRENGGKGGRGKGLKGEAVREKVATALIKAAPKGGWTSIAKFEMAYHRIAEKVPGFHSTEYQRQKIMARADVKKLLRTKEAVRDDVASALIELAPEGGWSNKDDVLRDFDIAAKKVADFKSSRKQYQMIMDRPAIEELLTPEIRRILSR